MFNVKELERAEKLADSLEKASTVEEEHEALMKVYKETGMKLPWGDKDPDDFFSDPNVQLVFE